MQFIQMKTLLLIFLIAITSGCQTSISDEKADTLTDTTKVNQHPVNATITLDDILKVNSSFIDLSAFDKPGKDTLFIEYITDGDSSANYIDPSPLFNEIKTKALSCGFKTVLNYVPQYIHSNKPGVIPTVLDNASHYFLEITTNSTNAKVIQTYRYPRSIGGQTFNETIIKI